jgi:UDP-N-acetylmuramate-alanine ligase
LHQGAYADAFAPADVTILAPVGRGEIPPEERLDIGAIAEQMNAAGGRAVACSSVDEAIAAATEGTRRGDVIVVMSNGRFDDAPDRILLRLMQR